MALQPLFDEFAMNSVYEFVLIVNNMKQKTRVKFVLVLDYRLAWYAGQRGD